MKYSENPDFFIKIINGKLILWDYRRHIQFELSIDHLRRILEISQGSSVTNHEIDLEIKQSGIFDVDKRKMSNWGWDCLSKIFHIGTQIVLEDGSKLPEDDCYEGYIKYCSSIVDKIPNIHYSRSGEITYLPEPNQYTLEETYFWDVLRRRKTSRSFIPNKISIRVVSDILYWTFGAIHGTTRSDIEKMGFPSVGYRRTSPSGGSLQASEAYLVVLQVDGLSNGIYHYDSQNHRLSIIKKGIEGNTLGSLLCAQMFASSLGFGIFVTSRFDKMWWKYPHSRAYRVALLDIGCLTQTFQLVTTALGLDSWPTGYFLDREINQLLDIDEINESVLFFLGAGHGTGSPISLEEIKIINRFTRQKNGKKL